MNFMISPKEILQEKYKYVTESFKPIAVSLGMVCDDGIVLIAENNRLFLKRVKEVSDEIAFIAAGDYSDLEQVFRSLLLSATVTEFELDVSEVSAKELAKVASEDIRTALNQQPMPRVVELAIAELSDPPVIYKVDYKGIILEKSRFFTLADTDIAEGKEIYVIDKLLRECFDADYAERTPTLAEAIQLAREVITEFRQKARRQKYSISDINEENMEVALLAPNRTPRLHRLSPDEIKALLAT